MIFLATPHRGSDSAGLLDSVLRASGVWKSPSYVSDLQRHSPSLQVISDEFKMYSDRLVIYSYYESAKTRVGLSRRYIVHRDSAALGYKNETVGFLNTDHRGTSRFSSPTDADFRTLRGTIVRMVNRVARKCQNLQAPSTPTERTEIRDDKKDMRTLHSFLATSDYPAEDLSNLQEVIGQNTCHWIEEKSDFRLWLDDVSSPRSLYWLTSKPGTGKSVLVAYLVQRLRSRGQNCAFYFFKKGDKSKQLPSAFLRSIALQFASMNAEARHLLLSMQRDDVQFNRDGCRAVWRTLFSGKLLDIKMKSPQYIIIDGLDECADADSLMTLLGRMENKFPLRILVTSRRALEFQRYFQSWGKNLICATISSCDTLRDIRTCVREAPNIRSFPEEKRPGLIDKIVQKSEGSFLWVRLVLQDITLAQSSVDIENIRDSVPAEMESLYAKALNEIASSNLPKDVYQSVLLWLVCAFRPLKEPELKSALSLDTGHTVFGFDTSVDSQYQHLICCRKNKTIEIVHSTAREFLLEGKSPHFPITRTAGHRRLAVACLKYLTSDDMRPPRHRFELSAVKGRERSSFADYACTTFSEHLALAPSSDDDLLLLLGKFLTSNVLSWIEYVLEQQNLHCLIRTAKNLRRYLERRAKHSSPLGVEFQMVQGWATDAIRLVAKFGRQMLLSPASIYFLIPVFCPSQSFIYRQFGILDDAIKVDRGHKTDWDDCVAWIEYRDSWAMSIASGDNVFALGMKSGNILLYNQSTCQNISSFQHGEPVKVLKFDTSGTLLASAGAKRFKLWDVHGNERWSYDLTHPCVTLSFSQDGRRLVALTRDNGGVELDVEDGSEIRLQAFTGTSGILAETSDQAPLAASISPDLSILAIVYRGRPIHLWSLHGERKLIGFCGREVGGISAGSVLFNPNPNINLLAIAYQDGELALHDPWTQKQLAVVDGGALTLASTPDGKTLASADGHGTIQLWDFETLTLLYRISGYEEGVDNLAFSNDGFRLMDLRYTVTQVWEPPALVRRETEEDSSASDLAQLPVPTATFDTVDLSELVAMVSHPTAPVVFAAKADGSVHYFDISSGGEGRRLYAHPNGTSITHLIWNEKGNVLISADNDGIILGRHLRGDDGIWKVSSALLKLKAGCPVRQLEFNPNGNLVLVSAGQRDSVWQISLTGGRPRCVGHTKFPPNMPRKWSSRPEDPNHLILLVKSEFRLFSWDTLNQISRVRLTKPKVGQYSLVKDATTELQLLQSPPVGKAGIYIIAGATPVEDQLSSLPFYIWNPAKFPDNPTSTKRWDIPFSFHGIKYVLGFRGPRLVFLDDDLWVCTYDLRDFKDLSWLGSEQAEATVQRQRHFFIPYDLATRTSGITASLSASGDITFAQRGQVAIVRCAWDKLLGPE